MTLTQKAARLAFSAIYITNRKWNDTWYWLYRMVHRQDPTVRIHGYDLMLDLTDEGITKDLLHIGGREFFSAEYLKGILKPDDMVFDIGANIGYYALMEGQHCKMVYAIEPVIGNYQQLAGNVLLNHMDNVHPIRCAVGDFNGEQEIFINDRSNWCSMTRPDYGTVISTELVPVRMLDTLVEQFHRTPSFVRMDVEGYEYQIIKGAKKTLLTPGLRLFIEVHPTRMPRDHLLEMLATLKDGGFVITKLFLEPEPWNYWCMESLNWLGGHFGFPGYGPHDPTYHRLMRLLDEGCCPEVFLEKVS